jgi:hypothetical protein
MQQTKQKNSNPTLSSYNSIKNELYFFFFLGSDDFLTLPDKTHVALKYSF